MNKKKYLIIGGGAVVREYYMPAFSYLNLLDSVTIVEPDLKAASILKDSSIHVVPLGFKEFFAQNEEIYDYAIITVPNYLHESAIKICLEKNIIVLCEKPLSLNVESCLRILAYQNQSEKKVYTGMVRRFMPSFKAMHHSLHLVGEIQDVQVEDGNPFAWIADSFAFFDPKNGGVLADMGVHYLDLLFKLFGPMEALSYEDDAEGGVEANCTYRLISKSNVPISLKLSRTHQLKNKFVITGSNGKLWIEKDQFDLCYFSPDADSIHEIKIKNAFDDPQLNYKFEACFVQQLISLRQEDANLVKLEEATATVKLIEDAYKSRQIIETEPNEDSYLITGGTGFIGAALIERLWKEGISNIVSPVRSYKNCAQVARFKIGLPRLNLLDYEAVKESLKDKKYVVHLAYSTDGVDAYEMNVTATQNIVRAACEQGAEAVVVLSTMNVYGFPHGNVTENSPQNPAGGDYGKTKKIMQKWCLEFAKNQHQTRVVILNPTCVYGPNGKTYTTLPRTLAKHNRFCWIEEGQGLANIVYIENLLDAILKSLTVKAAHAQNFIINDGVVTWKEFLTPLLGNKTEMTIPSLKKNELLNASFNEKATTKQIFRFLLTNFELVSLINAHPYLGKIKKTLFSKIPSFRGKLDSQRQIEWSTLSQNMLTNKTQEKFNPPIWLNELFGLTTSKFSAKKANDILKWKSKVDIETGIRNTKKWLEKTAN